MIEMLCVISLLNKWHATFCVYCIFMSYTVLCVCVFFFSGGGENIELTFSPLEYTLSRAFKVFILLF